MRKAILLTALLCAACSNYSANLPSIKPYKMDVQQGNVVTPKMMMQLRPGMTKAQVRFVMGTPLITDSFHANRWDYVYRMQKNGKLIETRHVILDFENDQLKTVRGDVIAAGSGGDAGAESKAANQAPRVLKSATESKPKEKGMLDTLMFWKKDEAPKAPATDEAKASAPAEAPAAAIAPQPAPESQPAAKAAPAPSQPVAAPAPQPAPKSAPVAESKPAAESKPVVESKPADEVKPVAQARPAAESKPATPPKEELKSVPRPEVELPPEEDPSYFERMLERIGF